MTREPILTNLFTFTPLKTPHLDLLCTWLKKPHVLKWWPDQLTQDDIKEKYSRRIGSSTICPYIVYYNNKPIGFIQYYWANKVDKNWQGDENTVGIDQLIGDIEYINKGYGTQMIEQVHTVII